jgi:polyisoprenyl-teichoic acid--peptidoglycan teichoic acid transferase
VSRLLRLAALTVVLGLAAGGVGALLRPGPASAVLTKVTPTAASASHDLPGPDEPFFVLLLGSDEREGLDGARADAIHIVGVNPAAGTATMLNVPRDTWVPIPGHREMRINEAYDLGGAELQVATVERFVGVPISYVLTTTFDGLAGMVDALGGVEVDVPVSMDDRNSGAVFDAGPVHMDGAQALAFSRNRAVPGGDLARTEHQGRLVVHTLEALRDAGTSPADVVGYLDVLFRNVRTEGIRPLELFRLGRTALQLDPGDVRTVTMPARLGTVGPAHVVFAAPGAASLFADFADDAVLQSH